jgi:hypothetical protein
MICKNCGVELKKILVDEYKVELVEHIDAIPILNLFLSCDEGETTMSESSKCTHPELEDEKVFNVEVCWFLREKYIVKAKTAKDAWNKVFDKDLKPDGEDRDPEGGFIFDENGNELYNSEEGD